MFEAPALASVEPNIVFCKPPTRLGCWRFRLQESCCRYPCVGHLDACRKNESNFDEW
jgi:hypothetical protein